MFFGAVSAFAQKINTEIPANSLVYALPKTSIEVSVEVKKEKYIPGPYARYAENLLSVSGVPTREETTYSIANVEMKPVVEADYEYLYSLPIGQKTTYDATFLTLSSEGLIFSLNDSEQSISKTQYLAPIKNFREFTDQLPSYPMETRKVSLFDRIKTDSGFVNVPYQQSVVDMKDPQKKAEEAAKFIFSLRERRFELVTGDVDNAFSGNSLKDALIEISRLEKEYLSLFIGKSFVETKMYKFYISPDKTFDQKTYNVCYFSTVDGVLKESTRTSSELTLDVTPSGKSKNIEGIKTGNSVTNIYYRVPETASIQLNYDSKELCGGQMQIYQMGKVLFIPYDAKLK